MQNCINVNMMWGLLHQNRASMLVKLSLTLPTFNITAISSSSTLPVQDGNKDGNKYKKNALVK